MYDQLISRIKKFNIWYAIWFSTIAFNFPSIPFPGNFGCGTFVDFQKAFDTADHNILIQKLNYLGVRGTANNWFSSFLENRTQFVSNNVYSSDIHFIRCGVPQGSFLDLYYIAST